VWSWARKACCPWYAICRSIRCRDPVAFGHALAARLKRFQGSRPQRDDETLVLIQRQTGIEQVGEIETEDG
jgi:hypothetical protein